MDGREDARAADADREATAERLRVALEEGRLDFHEYDERLGRAYAARTYGDLAVLVVDLPAPASADSSRLAVPDDAVPDGVTPTYGRSVTGRWLVEVWEPWLKVVGIVLAVWAGTSIVAGEPLYFWPGWVAGPWGAIVAVRTVTGLATGEPVRWAAKQDRRRRRRAEKRARKRERGGSTAVAGGRPEVGGPGVGGSEVAGSEPAGRRSDDAENT
ncbi:protein of unknown function [Micromonospora nigra]|uniref:DUF1707 domain-containing protein n=1 Tax=Micromonospora nigra TaxID=145857 RepID=A0A1C6RS44_9ACTN|nr:DUF1707 domain-containing protein [Micromonospora nigra]SCL19892.1 protein of unknown function [Micromonospora nigra]